MADRYRFAFDLGTNSIGWAVYELNQASHPSDLIDAGVRIFSDGRDPKSGASLAEERRGPRAMRRRRDRYLQRRTFLMNELIKAGLMPSAEADRKALEGLDPYVLRWRGLDERLSLHEFGRVIFHLNQRRGFQSNRIADAGKEDDGGKIKTAEKKLTEALAEQNCRTYGEFLAKRHLIEDKTDRKARMTYADIRDRPAAVRARDSVRIRLQGKDAAAHYEFYPTREILKKEFEALWSEQAQHHPTILTDTLKARLATDEKSVLYYQRPLKPPPIGKCTFYPEETRLAKSHPLSQARRIYQDLNHLRLKRGLDTSTLLTRDQRDKLAFVLLSGEDVTFKTGLRKYLKELPADTVTSLEDSGKADRLIGDQIAARLGHKKGPLKAIWGNLSPDMRAEIAVRLNTEPSEGSLIAWLMNTLSVSEDIARTTANIRLPDGHDHLGPTATAKVLEELKKDVIPYSEAVKRAMPDKHHSDERDGVIHDRLPFYGEVLDRHTLGGTGDPADAIEKRYGRLANPTVHVALNQLRRVVNALLERHGHPEQIVIELARDLKLSQKQKDELERENRKNRDKNDARRRLLDDERYVTNPGTLMLMRLWEELGPPMQRFCVYTGASINLHQLLSGDVEIEHILPYSRTLDDTFANKTLAFMSANRGKRNQAPSEAFRDPRYSEIRQRAKVLPPNKRWRFEPDAMERFENTERDFLARQLNETRHLAKLARKYLVGVANDPDDVWVVTGQLTAMLRHRFGLNSVLSDHNQKNRTDHRHHAIDACVIGICDRWLLKKISDNAGAYEHKDDLSEITKHIPPPFVDYRERVARIVNRIIVSHKPDHGTTRVDSRATSGALHNDTNYGINDGTDREEGELITRKAIDALTANEIDKVRDLHLRSQLQALKIGAGKDAKALKAALEHFRDHTGIRRVRILKKQEEFIRIKDRRSGVPYRAVIPAENQYMDIIEDASGTWRGIAVNAYDFNQNSHAPSWQSDYPGARPIMRVHKGDMIEVMDDDGVKRIKRVVRLAPSASRLYLASHNEAGDFQKRHDDPDDAFRWDLATISKLKDRGCRYVRIDEAGKRP